MEPEMKPRAETTRTVKLVFAAWLIAVAIFIGSVAIAIQARAQGIPGQPMTPLGYCQLTLSGSAAALSSCIRASFTATGSGTNLTVSALVAGGIIKVGDLVTGTGVPAGTKIVSQTSGTTGGNGVYVTSVATTSIAASLTSGGIPSGATMAYITVVTANTVYRDDGGVPTVAIGIIMATGSALFYTGTLSALQFFSATGVLNIAFYR
jgi:hypothetical protein